MNSLNRLDRRDTVGAPGKPDPGAELRERTAAIFGRPEREPEAELEPVVPDAGVPDAVPAPAVKVPGVRVFGDGPFGRLRSWLFVRCGLEFWTVLALTVVLAAAAGLAYHQFRTGRPREVSVPPPMAFATPALAPAPPPRVTIDIAGKVANPGLRRLPKGSRVADALSAAGGPLPGTDTTTLNLARPLADGEQILVGITPPPSAALDPTTTSAPTTPLSLNSATAAQLDTLPGVGPVLAQHILDFRTQHGGFTSLQQLRQVPGIGPRKFTTLQPLVHP
jgi:competence protein ComEA